MKGQIYEQIQQIIEEYGNGDPLIVKFIETKLFLNGIHRQRYNQDSNDDPSVSLRLKAIKKDLDRIYA